MASLLSAVKGEKPDFLKIRRALISVFDKNNLMELVCVLKQFDVEIISTGGTAKMMRENGIEVVDVSKYTNSPEILDGRVKTLHPKIHGGILAVHGNKTHEYELYANKMEHIDMVIMNLYPFEKAVDSGKDFDTCIENIDIGGPSMLRSAAKNNSRVTIVTSPCQYKQIINEMLSANGCIGLKTRLEFSASAFARSADYEASISRFFSQNGNHIKPITNSKLITTKKDSSKNYLIRSYEHKTELKYGCNPQQIPASLYNIVETNDPFKVINGKPGYINMMDACYAWQLVHELSQSLSYPAAASFKHCSPAGAAIGIPLDDIEAKAYEIEDTNSLTPVANAYIRARNADPMCSFGDFAAISHEIDECCAKFIKTTVCDGIIAPGFSKEALEILKSKKKGAFVILQADPNFKPPEQEFRDLYGITFSQRRNDVKITPESMGNIVTQEKHLPETAKRDMVLASICLKYTQSNSVGYSCNGQMIGVGAGQQSRVDCVKLAGSKVVTWFLRQHPKVMELKFKNSVKKQDRINARVRYIEGDITHAERPIWEEKFEEKPEPLTLFEKATFMDELHKKGVCISSDAFFPFRDSIDHASRWGVKYVVQPGGSIADEEIVKACDEYGMTMSHTGTRLFLH
jgi:phosphoribosylaminoimidazolecarboxamide formyltransferase / IMP cyclohydrolase